MEGGDMRRRNSATPQDNATQGQQDRPQNDQGQPATSSSASSSQQPRPTRPFAARRPSAFALAVLNEPRRHPDQTRSEGQEEVEKAPVRFSTDVDEDRPSSMLRVTAEEAKEEHGDTVDAFSDPPRLTIDTRAAAFAGTNAPLVASTDSAASPTSSKSLPISLSPTSPRARNRDRGYSLRRVLFNRTIHGDQPDGTHGAVIELGEAGPSNAASRTAFHSRSLSGGKKGLETVVTPIVEDQDDLAPRLDQKSKSSDSSRIGTLPNYESWIKEKAERSKTTRRLQNAYQRARRFVLRISEVPPSRDGRHIDIDAQCTAPLPDERTGKPYIGNTIRSSRYNVWDFVPRQLFAQFSKLANAYFLCVSVLQMIPGLSTTGTYTTIVPLMFFITISIVKEGYDDFRRYRLDKEENGRIAKVFRSQQSRGAEQEIGLEAWTSVEWEDVQVGDIVRLVRDDQVPADMVLLSSKGVNNTAYIDTMALDGETNLKSKQPPASLARTCDTLTRLAASNAHLVVEDPNLDLYSFEGKVTTDGETSPLSNNEIVYRGSILRNTPEAIGLVIYSGEECKIRMNASKRPRIKAPSLQFVVNKIVIAMVIFVLALSIFNTAAYQIWAKQVGFRPWYLDHQRVSTGPLLTSFIIMFNTMIPLSLYVSLEIVKIFQRMLLSDVDMYDEDSDTPMEARTSTINEELGQISYIFSDKTGTLTENSMKFRKLSVAGTAWLHDSDLKLEAAKKAKKRRESQIVQRKGKERVGAPRQSSASARSHVWEQTGLNKSAVDAEDGETLPTWRSSARPTKAQPEMHTIEMIRYIQRKPYTVFAKKARFFLLSMALCHTCLPETRDDGTVAFQAASPDELALVQAAQELGYMLADRHSGFVTIRTYPKGLDHEAKEEKFEILDTIEFSSKRKRMSIVVRFPDQRICVFSKGADSVLMKLLRMSALAFRKTTDIERRASVRKSLEVQQAIARRGSSQRDSSPGLRTSLGSIGRVSLSGPTTGHKEQLDSWLRERERDVDASVVDDQSAYSPRPSAQYNRSSFASSRRGSAHTEDDDFELVEEALAVDEPAVLERCFQHINDFATAGLRTLLYGYRFLGEEEYQTWRKVYRDATTSFVNRQLEVERAGELIEHSFELAGATAIEDKLQRGVPEAIDKLRRAGIKLWMLTGDKRETAINIGHSCRLIKDYSMVTILDIEKPHLEQALAQTIVTVTSPSAENTIAHSVVVVDGATLAAIDASPTLKSLFTDLAPLVDSVICCRASPAQKASLVRLIRRKVRSGVTLAIGDGANDIAMIQEAHVGIGITGKEGLQAARTSDYSIAQFRFLTKLLLVHGRWNYIRTAKYTAATFWKEMMFYLTQALYQRYTGYTATSLYESWSLTTFNTLFSSLPVIFLGILEQDLLPQTLLAVPELYSSMGLKNAAFNFRVYAWWIFLAASEAMLVFWLMYALYGFDGGIVTKLSAHSPTLASLTANSSFLRTINASSGASDGIYPLGALTFTACIIIISVKLQFLEMHNITFLNGIAVFCSVGGWFLWSIILSAVYTSNEIYHVRGGFLSGYGRDLGWWAALLVILVAVATLEVSWRVLRWVVGEHSWTIVNVRGFRVGVGISGPSDAEVFQCLQRDPELRARFEEAARGEMWFSLGEVEAEAEKRATEEREREFEFDELLKEREGRLTFADVRFDAEGLRRRGSLGV